LARPRERTIALVAVAAVQLALAFVLIVGLQVTVGASVHEVQRLIDITLPKPPPPPAPRIPVKPAEAHHSSSAPKAEPKPLGGSPGEAPAHAPPSVTPIIAIRPNAAPSGGGTGSGPATGAGAGGGTGGQGYGAGDGGSDLEHIGGEILPSDYPRDLGRAGLGGRVSVTFTVLPSGRVTGCRVDRSSGVPPLDALTCRLIEQRFRFRPSTDRSGRPIADEVDWDHDWIPPRG
jgi:protein TonB